MKIAKPMGTNPIQYFFKSKVIRKVIPCMLRNLPAKLTRPHEQVHLLI